jgi:glucose/mannose-6-phosphate isomerase
MTRDYIQSIDSQGMYDLIRTVPIQWKEGRERAADTDPGLKVQDIDQVIVAGMGGSAISGDLLRTLALHTCPVPISVIRSYELPAHVDEKTLVVACSYSGNTEETLSVLEDALSRNAKIFCITSGGRLEQEARQHGFAFQLIPGGRPPRAALGYALTALLSAAHNMGLIHLAASDWSETQQMLEHFAPIWSNPEGNQPLEMARHIHGRLPLIYSSSGFLEGINVRWRTQFQENAKSPAYGNFYPELNHNEIEGWESDDGLLEQMVVITLQDRDDHPQVTRRMEVTKKLLASSAAGWYDIQSQGNSPLTRMMYLIYYADWVSFYLSILRKADPTPIALIDVLKKTLMG